MVKGKSFASFSRKANKPRKKRDFREISWNQCQCSGSSQIPSQDDIDDYHQFLSLYKIKRSHDRTELTIYDTENEKEEVKALDTDLILDHTTSITQLPNGELFCYGNLNSGITLIIDKNYGVRMLPSGTNCWESSALYFNNNIYCFGGYKNSNFILSRKFDLKNNMWLNLVLPSEADYTFHSVIFDGNILISGYWCKSLWLYSIEIDSFSIIPYEFAQKTRKFMINVKRLYLIEWYEDGLIYESEDEYHWKPISKSGSLLIDLDQMYCLHNKEKIYISTVKYYYQFDLKKKVVLKIT